MLEDTLRHLYTGQHTGFFNNQPTLTHLGRGNATQGRMVAIADVFGESERNQFVNQLVCTFHLNNPVSCTYSIRID